MKPEKKIKILHINASPAIGGAERALLTLLKNINRENFDLVLGMFIDQRNSTNTNLLWKEAENFDIPLEPIRFNNPYDLLQILQIYRIVKKHRPDIIHTHGYKTNILAFIVARLFRIPIVSTVHGLYPTKMKTDLFVRLSLVLLRYFDRIISVSDETREVLESKKIPSKKIITVRNVPPENTREYPLNVSTFREEIGVPSNIRIIGFVGRLEKVKGCAQLVEAISKIHRTDLDFCLVVVGEGPEKESLEFLVRKLGLKNNVYFCGFRNDPINVFQSLDLFVLPSLSEGTPLAMLEAMSLGVPVVATRVGGVPEVIKDKVNGLLVPPQNPDALAAGIMETLINRYETERRINEAKKTINNEYSIEKWIEKNENIYLEIINQIFNVCDRGPH